MDKNKVMIFKDGPEEGNKTEWFGKSGPPPVSICIVSEDTYGVYQRNDIQPSSQKIKYYYEFDREIGREEAEENYKV